LVSLRRTALALIAASTCLSLFSGCGGTPILKVTTTTPSVTLYPDNVTTQGVTVAVTYSDRRFAPISVSLQGLPPGVLASPAVLPMVSDGQAAFEIKATTTAGGNALNQGKGQATYPITIKATSGTQQASVGVNLTIAGQNPNYLPTKMDLPVLTITTDSGAPVTSETDYLNGNITITPPATSTDASFAATMQIRGHGNTTWILAKKPYKVKLDNKAGLLGMAPGKTWILLANYDDKSLLRDQVAFETSRRLGMAWTPNSRFVEKSTKIGSTFLRWMTPISRASH
jgi:hypothetical protein